MKPNRDPNLEQYWFLTGLRRGRIWYARKNSHQTGEAQRVQFDPHEVLQREEHKGDVIGFLHTHPNMKAIPSQRDIKTMRAWASCFGKPLLCLIEGDDGLRGYVFADDKSAGVELDCLELFPRGILIGVERAG